MTVWSKKQSRQSDLARCVPVHYLFPMLSTIMIIRWMPRISPLI